MSTTATATPAGSAPSAAPATPAPSATPAAAAAAPSTPAARIFDHIKTPESSPADTKPATPATPPAAAAEPGKTPDSSAPAAGETTTPPAFKASIRGKEYTGEELVKAYENSSTEGMRLNGELKKATQYVTSLESKIAEMEAKISEEPPFKILSKEELRELDAADQTEYVLKKNAWEQQKKERTEKLAKIQETRKAELEETKTFVLSRSEEMYNNPEKWPGYKDMLPVMEQILDRLPILGGHKETPDILYYAALGLQKHREGHVSKTAEEKARQEAAANAAAQAAAQGAGNPPAPVQTQPDANDDSDEAFAKRILAKAATPLFKS